jgi:CHAD domain-containing protein
MPCLHERRKGLSRDLAKFVAKLSEDVSEKSVHRLRTTIRRLETLVDAGVPRLRRKQKKALDDLRVLRKRAGKVRDLDIQTALLGSIGNGSASADRRVLAEVLKARRERQVARLVIAVKKLDSAKLFDRLARIAEDSGPEDTLSPATLLEELQERLSQLAQEYGSRRSLKPARLHDLRIKVKLLRYRAELAQGAPGQDELIEKLRHVQGLIGEWHDWGMLAESADEHFRERVNCALLVEIRSLFAARYSAADSAAASLLTAYAPAGRKKPLIAAPDSRPAPVRNAGNGVAGLAG